MGSEFDEWIYWDFFAITINYYSSHTIFTAEAFLHSAPRSTAACRQSQSHIATNSPSVSKSWCRTTSGAHGKIFLSVWQLRVCWYGALSLTIGRVYRLHLLLTLASAVFLGSESQGTRDHILLSQIWDFPFRRLLRLAGSRWRYSTPPPHGYHAQLTFFVLL
jgi:hypothetical protein